MHRIRRHEPERTAAGTAEGLQQLLQNLVGTVCRPEVLDAELHTGGPGQGGGEVGTEGDGIAIGIAVQLSGGLAHRRGDIVDQGRRRRVRVLVGVEDHRNPELRCAISALATEVLT